MNLPEIFGLMVGEDPQLYLEEVKKITHIMHISEVYRVELSSYRLKDVAHDWVAMWEKSREENVAPSTW